MIEYRNEPNAAVLTISDLERHNPLSTSEMGDLEAAIRRADADDAARVIVITGAGDRTFSAGGDLSSGFVDDPIGLHRARGAFVDLLVRLNRVGKPTVARVNGHALAGGFGLTQACDFVVASERAMFGVPEIDVGLWPMMISAVLLRTVPRRAAIDLMMTGRRISAEEARAIGAVNRVVPHDELDRAVGELVETLASKSASVLRMGRQALAAAGDLPLEAALDTLQVGLTAESMTGSAKEGVAAFKEKRSPSWPD